MEQLRMYFEKGSVKEFPLPEGYSFEYFRGSREEILDWLRYFPDMEFLILGDNQITDHPRPDRPLPHRRGPRAEQ